MLHKKNEPFQNVGAGQKAIIPSLPLGEVYHGIVLELGGTTFTKALIERIVLRLGGKVIWDVTGSQLDTINSYLGYTANVGYLLIPFSEFTARTVLGEQIGAIDTVNFNYSGFSIEVNIGAGAVAPTLESHRLVTTKKTVSRPEHLPLFRAMIEATHDYASASTYNFPIPLGSNAGALLKRVHYFHSNITQQTVKFNGMDIYDEIPIALAQFWQNNLTRVTQAGHLCFDPITLDDQSAVIPTMAENNRPNRFEWRNTLSAADNIVTLSEVYGAIGSL